jgi:hypothetical protein
MTRKSLGIGLGFALFAVLALLALDPTPAAALSSHYLPLGGLAMIRIWGQPLDMNGLDSLKNPGRDELESYPHIIYDRQTYAQAGQASVSFFSTLSNDPTITNMEAAGQFPSPQWFQPFGIMVTPMAAGPSNITPGASGTNLTGIQNDWDLLTKTQRAVLSLSIAKKQYGPWPVLALHGTGGAMGFFTNSTASLTAQQVQNGWPDGGFGPQGEIVIPPNVGWSVTIQLAAAQAVTVATLIEVAIVGRLYRAVR